MKLSIRTKIIVLTTGIMSFAIAAIILASSYRFVEAYTETLQSRTLAVSKSLKLQLDRLLQIGLGLENLTGFGEQCQEIVNKYDGILYALVADSEDGRILFHSDGSQVGRTVHGTALIEGVKSRKEIVVRVHHDYQHGQNHDHDHDHENEHGHWHKDYTAFIPVFDKEGRHIAAIGIGACADVAVTKTRQAAFFSFRIGALFLAGAVVALLITLSASVTKPLTKLVAVIHEMIEKKEVSTRKIDTNARDEIGEVVRAFNMMTESLRHTMVTKEAYEHQATHDALTGLPNRSLLVDRLTQAILLARRHQNQIAVMFMDLDNFKLINDSLGHDTGDQVLITVANRLKDTVRASDTVSRQAGDEFVLIITDLSEAEDAAKVADKIIESVTQPLVLENHDVSTTCSMGISIYPKDGDTVSELLKHADAALYRAKDLGKNSFQFFTAKMNVKLYERMLMERQLHQALERNEFILHYQPRVSLHSGRMVGMEALLRWMHPEKGLVMPGTFITLAEEIGLIEPIGEWVLKTACRQAKAWHRAGLPKLPVAVNLSARQFRRNSLVKLVKSTIEEAGLEAADIELEVTESLLMLNTDSVRSILWELKEFGIQLNMDDFGTGYSSLSYLKRFPFDKLKLDISFVRNITRDPHSAAIVLAIIAMAHSLNLKVVAEGVETLDQLNYLRLHGCDEMQGYYFSRPVSAEDFEGLVRQERCLLLPSKTSQDPDNTILLVDDDAKVLSALKRALGANGYRILTATDAEEGFELLANNSVGLVIADHFMPAMKGTEFLARIRELHPNSVRIALTGSANLDIVLEAVNRGAIFKFITKPWSDEALKQTVHEALRLYARQTQEVA